MPQFNSRSRFLWIAIVAFTLMALPACGGGGHGYGGEQAAPPLVIQTSVLPALMSGWDVEIELEVTGGCQTPWDVGGIPVAPFVVQVISPGVNGGLPPGLGVENRVVPHPGPDTILNTADDQLRNAAFLVGILLANGNYGFEISVKDTACTPFYEHSMAYNWFIGVGAVRIVGADPELIPQDVLDISPKYVATGTPPAPGLIVVPNHPDPVDAFPTTVYGQFTAIDVIAAGGIPPYTLIHDQDPTDPNDDLLMPWMDIAAASISGTPEGALPPGGLPYLLSLRAQDSTGQQSAIRKVQWKIDTPPIIMATETVADVYAGATQNELFQIADGVPPFAFELMAVAGPENYEDHVYPADPAYPPAGFPADGNVQFPKIGANGTILLGAPNFATGINVGLNGADAGMADRRLYKGVANRNVLFAGNDNSAIAEDYPAESDIGPSYGPYPSEGTFLYPTGASAGTLSGIPRRVGEFTIHVHAYSTTVPNAYGQHGFKTYTFNVMDSNLDPIRGAFQMTPAMTVEGVFLPGPDFSSIQDAAKGPNQYDPDDSVHPGPGLLCTASGGVAFDGVTDGPHETDVFSNPWEVADRYTWTVNYDPLSIGTLPYGSGAPGDPNVTFLAAPDGTGGAPWSDGVWGVTPEFDEPNLTRTSRAIHEFIVEDLQLPKVGVYPGFGPFNMRNADENNFGFSVGPDVVIITEGSTSYGSTLSLNTGYGQYNQHTAFRYVKKFSVVGGSSAISPLDSNDLASGTVIPAATTGLTSNTALGELLSGQSGGDDVELIRITVNPTGWWDDVHNVSYYGAKAGQHADPSRGYSMYGYNMYAGGGWSPNGSCVDLPRQNVKNDAPPNLPGTYAGEDGNGGRLYCFNTTSHMGFFIIRRDASIYVPFSTDTTTYKSFGDNLMNPRSNNIHSSLRTIQITVSPDGRFAAAEMTTHAGGSQSHHLASATVSKIVIFSLCGEALWGGNTYKIVDVDTLAGGLSQVAGYGKFMYSTSMAASNTHVYFMIGLWWDNSYSSSGYFQAHWRDKYICRVPIQDGTTLPTLAPGDNTYGNWTQTSSQPMQAPFHVWNRNGGTYYISYSSYGSPYYYQYGYDSSNFLENETAPMPFRVSGNGRAVGLLAGPRWNSTSTSSNYSNYYQRHFVWVDYDGTGFTQAKASLSDALVARRCPNGGMRGYSMGRGNYSNCWLYSSGPSTHFEMSFDGKRCALVYYATTAYKGGTSYSYWAQEDEEVWAYTATGGGADPWVTCTAHDVTALFSMGQAYWRFGSLVFTKDDNGLIFWGGYSSYNQSSYSYADSRYSSGTYYSYEFSSGTLKSILARNRGGSTQGIKTYSGSSLVAPGTGQQTGPAGRLRPVGGFIAKNRDFLYICTHSGINTGTQSGTYHNTNMQTDLMLVGFNIRSLNTAANINGYPDGQGFLVDSWPSRYGFGRSYVYYSYYGIYNRFYAPGNSTMGFGQQSVAIDTGEVFFGSHYQSGGPYSTTTYGPSIPVYCYDYGRYGGTVYAFKAEVAGPVVNLSGNKIGTGTAGVSISHLEVAPKGDRCAVVAYHYSNYAGLDYEKVYTIQDLAWDPTDGTIGAQFDPVDDCITLEGTSGRASESVVFDTSGKKLYYAFKSGGGGNENAKKLTEQTIGSGGVPASVTSSTTKWYNVLYCGR